MMTQSKTDHQGTTARAVRDAVNNSAEQISPRSPPLYGSATTFDRRGARAAEHEARPPARSSSLSSTRPHNQNPKTTVVRFAHGKKKYQIYFRT